MQDKSLILKTLAIPGNHGEHISDDDMAQRDYWRILTLALARVSYISITAALVGGGLFGILLAQPIITHREEIQLATQDYRLSTIEVELKRLSSDNEDLKHQVTMAYGMAVGGGSLLTLLQIFQMVFVTRRRP